MTTVMPEGEKIRQAVKWISERRKEDPGLSLTKVIQQASARFNLSPKEEEELKAFYQVTY